MLNVTQMTTLRTAVNLFEGDIREAGLIIEFNPCFVGLSHNFNALFENPTDLRFLVKIVHIFGRINGLADQMSQQRKYNAHQRKELAGFSEYARSLSEMVTEYL